MFGFFKKKGGDKSFLRNWHIPVDDSFLRIDNSDSVQFVSAVESVTLYFSVLIVSDQGMLPESVLTKMQPSVSRGENGWEFRAVKQDKGNLLICVFSFINETDEKKMRALFEEIKYVGK